MPTPPPRSLARVASSPSSVALFVLGLNAVTSVPRRPFSAAARVLGCSFACHMTWPGERNILDYNIQSVLIIAGRVPVSASRLLDMALSPRSFLWEQLRGSTATFTAGFLVSSVNHHCGRYVYKKQCKTNISMCGRGWTTTVIKYSSWSISLPALSRASRYFSDTIGIPIFTACRVPRPVADMKHHACKSCPGSRRSCVV